MLTEEEKKRYDRQIRVSGLGEAGQEKLKQAKVFVAGVGALGSAVCAYLATAGVGYLRIVDRDVVELSNLSRQILHWTGDIGERKAGSARAKLHEANPCICVEALSETIEEKNAWDLAEGCDVIVDAVDNYETRYALNKAALKRGMPFVHGGIHGMEGVVTTIVPGETACLRCAFPTPPPLATVPVLGTVAGVIGCLQATETLKYIAGVGQLLRNRLLVFDGVDLRFREVALRRDPECPECARLGRPAGKGH